MTEKFARAEKMMQFPAFSAAWTGPCGDRAAVASDHCPFLLTTHNPTIPTSLDACIHSNATEPSRRFMAAFRQNMLNPS
jgi:hypothetical protein